ncbi:MAG: ATP-binding protein [Myxococcota bacterium]|nr:ATP-binding protein [Myxococcota bacterium]
MTSRVDGGAALAAGIVGALGLWAAISAALHFALIFGGAQVPRRAVVALYSSAAACAALDFITESYSPGLHSGWGAQRFAAFGIAVYSGAVASSIVVLVVVARTYLAGRKEALAVVVGATVLVATVINDAGVSISTLTSGHLVDAGLAAFIVAVMTTRSARFAGVTRELDRRTQELRTRTSELRHSYEDLRAAQEELVKKEQLAVVGELAAVIAHEVRNPLAIIANAVAGLRKQAISRQDHETLLAILDEEASRLNRLVTDLLRYARPVNLQRSDFSLADVLDRAVTLASKDRTGIKTQLTVEGHDGRTWGDPNLLRHVFDNLIANAVQAMGAGGVLTVRVRAVTVDGGVYGVAVDIIDTGEGMDTQVRSRARDPFFTTRPSGTGLGLAIVDRIVDAHGGHLSIESRAGEGTTATVFLPESSPSEPAPPRNRGSRAPTEISGPAGATRAVT